MPSVTVLVFGLPKGLEIPSFGTFRSLTAPAAKQTSSPCKATMHHQFPYRSHYPGLCNLPPYRLSSQLLMKYYASSKAFPTMGVLYQNAARRGD